MYIYIFSNFSISSAVKSPALVAICYSASWNQGRILQGQKTIARLYCCLYIYTQLYTWPPHCKPLDRSSGCWRSLRFGNSVNYAMMVSCKCECRKTMIFSKLNDGSFGDFLKWGYPQRFPIRFLRFSMIFHHFVVIFPWNKSPSSDKSIGLPPWRKPYGIPRPQLEAGPSSGKSVFSIRRIYCWLKKVFNKDMTLSSIHCLLSNR
jgi:hypothetical protein